MAQVRKAARHNQTFSWGPALHRMKTHAELEAENEALRQPAPERGQALVEALAALSSMQHQIASRLHAAVRVEPTAQTLPPTSQWQPSQSKALPTSGRQAVQWAVGRHCLFSSFCFGEPHGFREVHHAAGAREGGEINQLFSAG